MGGHQIYTNGGYIRKVESLGDRRLPNTKKAGGERVTEGTYFCMECDLQTATIAPIADEFGRDKDIIQKYLVASDPVMVKSSLVLVTTTPNCCRHQNDRQYKSWF